MRSIGDEYFNLSVEDAAKLSDERLRECFWLLVIDIRDMFDDEYLPENFPTSVDTMTREEILSAIAEHAHLFNPGARH